MKFLFLSEKVFISKNGMIEKSLDYFVQNIDDSLEIKQKIYGYVRKAKGIGNNV